MSFIEPLKIAIESKELCPESSLVEIDIANKHPHNDLLLFSVNLSMNTTVRDFDGDSSRIGERGQNIKLGQQLLLVDEGMLSRTSQKDSESNMNDDDRSTTSTDEGNVEEYLRIIRADRFFHVTEITTKDLANLDEINSMNFNQGHDDTEKTTYSCSKGETDSNGFLRIKSGCSHKFAYRISVKNAGNLVVGNFLTPLGIRYIDINPLTSEIVIPASDSSTSSNNKLHRSNSHLSSSSQVNWSLGTDYLNRSAFSRNVHVYNLCSAQSGFHGQISQREKRVYQVSDMP